MSEISSKKYIGRHVKHPLFLSDLMKKKYLDRRSKTTQISRFMKILRVGAELFIAGGRTGRQTDRHGKANSSFTQFCEGG
jgi:hypothetical protein